MDVSLDVRRFYYDEKLRWLRREEKCTAEINELPETEYARRYPVFMGYVRKSIALAKAVSANLFAYIVDDLGYIDLIAESLLFDKEKKTLLDEIVAAAAAVSISPCVDTRQGFPTDMEDGIKISLWFEKEKL